MSFEEAYSNFLVYSQKRYKKEGFYNLRNDFNSKVLPYFKNYDIFNITKKDILKWQNIILGFNYSNNYNKRLCYSFNAFLDYCCLYYDLPENILRSVGSFPKKVEFKKTDFYTLKEFKTFVAGFEKTDFVYKSYFTFMFFTGTRPSETMALKFSDLHGKYISITKSIQRHGNRELCTLKTSSSEGNIILAKIVRKDILKLKKYYIKKYNDVNYDYFIFGGKNPLSPTSIDRYKLKACQKAHIRPITQHQFRHSYATYLTSKGIPINVVSKMLRHSSVEITAKVYIHQSLEYEKRVYNTLNSGFNIFYNLRNDFKR